jgi:crotonobetainyl-CoA:carnitine CoA-transferase CaiB-like acyl-CoA transferase
VGKHRYAGAPYQLSATPARPQGPAPLLGQHSREICCTELGYSSQEFEQLQRLEAV